MFLSDYGIDFIFVVTVIAAMQIETFMSVAIDEFLMPYIHEDAQLEVVPGGKPFRLTRMTAILLRTFIIFALVWVLSRFIPASPPA